MVDQNRLRFKVVSSFGIAVLGVAALIRLLSIAPPSNDTALAYCVVCVLIAAAVWRGIIYWRAARAHPPARS